MEGQRHYDYAQALWDHTLGELTAATEEYLASWPKIRWRKGYEDPTYHNAMCRQFREAVGSEEGLVLLTAESEGRFGVLRKTELCIDETNGEKVRSWCNCHEFEEKRRGCRHTDCLVIAYLMDRYGADCLRGTSIEEMLRDQTGVKDPFVPGCLRRTDHSLKGILDLGKKAMGQKKGVLDAPSWLISERETNRKSTSSRQLLHAEVFLSIRNRSLAVELRVGPKRPYVVRDVEKLLQAYREGKTYAFTPSVTLPVGRSMVDKASQPVMDFLERLLSSAKGTKRMSVLLGPEQPQGRYLYLYGSELDRLMELLDGRSVTFSNEIYDTSEICQVDLKHPARGIAMEKTEFGADLSIPHEILLGQGMERMYLIQDGVILSQPVGLWEQHQTLEEASRGSDALYVREQDIPAICTSLAPLREYPGMLELRGMELADYLEEVPEFEIRLDYPQKNMISCEVNAHYRRNEKTYSVLDQKKDRKKRNLAAEQPVGEALWQYFDACDMNRRQMVLECDDEHLYHFLVEVIPRLSEYGEVLISDRLKKLQVKRKSDLQVGIQLESGSLLVSLQTADLSREEMIELLSSYRRRTKFTRLKNGTFVVNDTPDEELWAALAEGFRNYGRKNPEAFRMPAFRALYLDELMRDRETLQVDSNASYRELILRLTSEDHDETPIPESLREILRPYQVKGFRWLKLLKSAGLGGILADEMGLGKTLQVMAFLLSEYQDGKRGEELRTLIVAPASLVYNWQKELQRFVPELSWCVIAGSPKGRKDALATIGTSAEAAVYITSYDLLKRDIDMYENLTFANQVIDEAQYIKNYGTQVAKAVRVVNSTFRVALTGTPIENRLSDMWSIFDYVMPGFLGAYERYRTDFEGPIVNEQDADVMDQLRRLVHPFILRRRKQDVLTDLPEKLEEEVAVQLTGEQRKLYDAYAGRLKMFLERESEEDFRQGKLEILAELTKLRRICCGPELMLEDYHGSNAKMEACLELLHRAIDGGHKILLFSQFTSVLDELDQRLNHEKISHYRIDGSVSKEKRSQLVEAFQNDDTSVFCISLKAGGTGLNLTAADIVIHYDPWWNQAVQNQATDRTHRIGQENTVTVYQLIAEDTIEERIVHLQRSKAQLADDILAGESIASTDINREDLIHML